VDGAAGSRHGRGVRIQAALAAATVVLAASRGSADKLAPDDLAHKKDGGYVTGLPLFAYGTDLGLGLGARVYYYWDGARDDHRFAETPYLYRLFLQVFASTRGIQFHWLDLDAPRIFDTPYRIRSELVYGRNTNSNYFGHGERALAPLAVPGSALTYGSYADYTRDQARVGGDGQAFTKYDQYDLLRPAWLASIERLFADDRIRVLAGFGITYSQIRDYTGKQIDAVDAAGRDTQAAEATTRLRADCDAGRLVGCSGGRDDVLRLGISYDSGTVALGSQYDYVRVMVAARGYWSPVPERADLVVAGRVLFEAQSNGAPFFSMDTLPFTEDPRQGLGGHRTIRGFRQDRFVGSVMTAGNAELRWTFGHLQLLGQRFGFIVAPFVDAGRPYDSLGQLSPRNWRTSYGGAFRVAWNLATVGTVDYGRSAEDTGFYVNFNHTF
jgi:hypothetical protein